MRRIKKRNLNTIRIKRDAYVGNVKDEEEVIVEETVDITPERVTMEEKTEPVCADVAADVENSVEEAETEAEAAEEKAEADVAEETVAEEIGEADVAEEVEVAEETAPAEEVESVEEPAEDVESVEEPVEEEAESVEEPAAEEIAEETAEPAEEVVEDTVTVTPDEVVFDEEEKPVAESEETDVEEAVLEAEAEETETAEAAEDTADAVEEVTEEVEEVPLEASEEESEEILDEEGSLDGTEEEVKELAQAEETEVGEVEEAAEEVETEEVEEPEAEAVEETATEETETAEEEKPSEKTEKEVFKLTTPANQDDILSRICVKRGRKLIYRPNEIIFNCTAAVTGTDKNNEEGIKVKSILDEEIKQGVKLGYIDKYDGLKMSEIKEEYENDVVYEYAEQEFKRVGLVLDGEKVKVYVYDWDMKALHHIGFVDQANVADLKPYLEDKEKYSFDVCGLITGGKFRKVIKDEATGKVTIEKGNDGKLGVELDISVINRKD